MGQDVGRNNRLATGLSEGLDDEQPERAAAVHTGANPWSHLGQSQGVYGDS